MKKIYKNIVFVFPLLLLCVIMIFASFYDLQISQTLADLNFGQYYSQNLFGRFFEIVGETPVYFLSSFSFCIFTMYFIKKNNKKTLNILLVILFAFISTFLNFISFFKMFSYISKLNNFSLNLACTFFEIILAIYITMLFLYFLNIFNVKDLKKLCLFALATVLFIVFTNVIVQGIKPIFSRTRYRAMTYLNQKDFINYTPWYKINKNNSLTALQKTQGLTLDIFKSFPSGHTAGALSVLSLIYLFKIFKIKKSYKIIIVLFASFYTLCVGLSRIVMGAHFLSDVIFSLIVGYLCFLLVFFALSKSCSKVVQRDI